MVLPLVIVPVLAQNGAPPSRTGGFSIADLDTTVNACTAHGERGLQPAAQLDQLPGGVSSHPSSTSPWMTR
jgi:hypothetical protein